MREREDCYWCGLDAHEGECYDADHWIPCYECGAISCRCEEE